LLLRSSVQARLAEFGLRPHFEGRGARVVAQDPPAGGAVERGASVTVWTSAPDDSAGRALPDLAGVPLREALRRLTRLEVRARIEGLGVVVRQSPAPGTPLPLAGECRLWCEPSSVSTASANAGEPARLARNEEP
jgi:beta-lactam-binding protein with PASTA domain